ncbi:MAG: arsenite methyltransferase [Cyclobacteriaceae bacterium]|nr:arsenite methyltransferase [Cyclobacteriaceae bacterium]
MTEEIRLKQIVRDRYAKIADQEKASKSSACCGSTTPENKVYNIMMDDYTGIEGYQPDADLGLGCGLPTQFAKISKGDTVIDLGSGAGNDCFVARHETGLEGKVIGIDFTPEMIRRARINAEKLGYNNVEFREGDIDNMPVNDNTANVVVSNCVLNLIPDKPKVMKEIYRVLKPGGHFSISDIVMKGNLPAALKKDAEMYAGCIAGAIQREDYLQLIQDAGFVNISLQKEKTIEIPDDLLRKYLNEDEISAFKSGNTGIYSISVYGEKPAEPLNISTKSNVSFNAEIRSGCC